MVHSQVDYSKYELQGKFECQGETIQDGCKTPNDARWEMKKAQEKKFSGVTNLDRIRNERIRGTTKVGEISNVQESGLKWYGHVGILRREQESDGGGGAREKDERTTEAEVVG